MKIPTVTTLRRWKRDALEEAFSCRTATNPLFRKYILMLENFAKACDILVNEYPHIQNYDRISQENHDLRNRLSLREVTKT